MAVVISRSDMSFMHRPAVSWTDVGTPCSQLANATDRQTDRRTDGQIAAVLYASYRAHGHLTSV